MDITFTKAEQLKSKPDENNLGFGTHFTDYMFNMDYSAQQGWHNPRIEPYGPLPLDPSTMVLHYGQAIFEGLKAYKGDNGDVFLFRPKENFKRFNLSAERLCIPQLDIDFALKCLIKLIALEKEWVPGAPGTSLYIRPTIIATDPYLGLRSSHTYRFFIILSPVGAYILKVLIPLRSG